MGKAELCMQMLTVLSSGRMYGREELARLLDTNVRNISAYRVELQNLGYEFVTDYGRFGGMRLSKSCLFPALKLNEPERHAMQEAMDFVLAQDEFIHRDAFITAMGKMYSANDIPMGPGILVIDSTHPSIDNKELAERYDFVANCIAKDHPFVASYPTKDSEKLTFHPYKLFLYNEEWRLFAYCPQKGEITDFSLACLFDYCSTEGKIAPWRDFDAERYYDRFGLRREQENEVVEFYVLDEAVERFAGREFGTNQTLWKEDGRYRCRLEMQDHDKILRFLLSQGADIEVLAPAWAKEEILAYCKAMAKLYKDAPTGA